MKNRHPELNGLGLDDWFEQRAGCKPADTIARVAAVDRGQWLLVDQAGPFRAEPAGSDCIVITCPMKCPASATGCAWRNSRVTTLSDPRAFGNERPRCAGSRRATPSNIR